MFLPNRYGFAATPGRWNLNQLPPQNPDKSRKKGGKEYSTRRAAGRENPPAPPSSSVCPSRIIHGEYRETYLSHGPFDGLSLATCLVAADSLRGSGGQAEWNARVGAFYSAWLNSSSGAALSFSRRRRASGRKNRGGGIAWHSQEPSHPLPPPDPFAATSSISTENCFPPHCPANASFRIPAGPPAISTAVIRALPLEHPRRWTASNAKKLERSRPSRFLLRSSGLSILIFFTNLRSAEESRRRDGMPVGRKKSPGVITRTRSAARNIAHNLESY